MDELITSSIAIGEESFDIEGLIEIRECTNDSLFPLALEGVTKGGHDVSISLSEADVQQLYDYFTNL